MDEYLKQTTKAEVKMWINSVVVAHLKTNPENQGEIEHIIDYLNSDNAPRRLRKMSYMQAKSGAEKWMRAQVKKGNNIVETEEDVEIILRSRTTGFKLVKLLSKNAFMREGSLMGHCVASYFNKSGVEIYSLRDAMNQPHCTIELVKDNQGIQQVKGKGNGPIHPKYINYVLKSLKKLGVTVKASEMNNLGYYKPTDDYMKFLVGNFPKTKTLTFGGETFVYNRSLE